MAGIDAALKLGADFIVNTDADNQYVGADIALLIEPLVRGEADIVIGDRNIQALSEMSAQKKRLQRLGSWVVRQVSGTQVPDTTSGFRAYTREAALRMTIVSEFSYTLESIIQAGKQRMAIAHVPVRTNPRVRPSRLFDSVCRVHQGLERPPSSASTRCTSRSRSSRTSARTIFLARRCAVTVRFLYYYFTGTGRGHVQSLILSAVLMIVGFQVLLIGLVSRRDLRQPQAARGPALPRPLDRARSSASRRVAHETGRAVVEPGVARGDAVRRRRSSSRRSTKRRAIADVVARAPGRRRPGTR